MFEKIKTTLLDFVDCDPSTITRETQFLKDLKMSSFDIVSLIGQIEDEFGITIDMDDIQNVTNVGELADYLSDRI